MKKIKNCFKACEKKVIENGLCDCINNSCGCITDADEDWFFGNDDVIVG